ncbi:MAG: metal-binding protein [Oscillospiraceae bacterium]|nr:metal-binding protein [Oscillospiraceae bacterium]
MLEAKIGIEEFVEKYVDTERFGQACSQYGNYNKRWSCPEYDFDTLGYWRNFKTLRVFAEQIFTGGKGAAEAYAEYGRMKNELDERLLAMESEGSVSLAAGSCSRCAQCTRTSGKPCVHPDAMRYSIESLGGDVVKTAAELLGTEIKWAASGELPEYFLLVGGLLEK